MPAATSIMDGLAKPLQYAAQGRMCAPAQVLAVTKLCLGVMVGAEKEEAAAFCGLRFAVAFLSMSRNYLQFAFRPDC